MPADGRWDLTLILLTWRIWWAPNNASRWQMGFSWAFKVATSALDEASVIFTLWPLYPCAESLFPISRKNDGSHIRCGPCIQEKKVYCILRKSNSCSSAQQYVPDNINYDTSGFQVYWKTTDRSWQQATCPPTHTYLRLRLERKPVASI